MRKTGKTTLTIRARVGHGLRLRGVQLPAGAAGVVIDPGWRNLDRRREALIGVAQRPHLVPFVRRLSEPSMISPITSCGPVDLAGCRR